MCEVVKFPQEGSPVQGEEAFRTMLSIHLSNAGDLAKIEELQASQESIRAKAQESIENLQAGIATLLNQINSRNEALAAMLEGRANIQEKQVG